MSSELEAGSVGGRGGGGGHGEKETWVFSGRGMVYPYEAEMTSLKSVQDATVWISAGHSRHVSSELVFNNSRQRDQIKLGCGEVDGAVYVAKPSLREVG